jgi:hypothetical protein
MNVAVPSPATSAKRLDRWLFAAVDERQIAALRIGYSLLLIVRLLHHDFLELARQPEGLYRPLSYMKAFPAMPGESLTITLLVIALTASACSAAGIRSRLFLPLATVCALVLFGMTTSSGKVMHNDSLLLLCLLPLALGTTDNVWSVASWIRRRRHEHSPSSPTVSGWPWRAAVLLVCGAYFFSGFAKLTHSGLDWVFSDNMRWILYANSDGRSVPNPVALFVADRPWLAWMSGAGIFSVELLFPLVLWKPVLWRLFVPAVVAMHIITWFTLRLDYSAMATVVVLTAVFWPAVTSRLASSRAALVRSRTFDD